MQCYSYVYLSRYTTEHRMPAARKSIGGLGAGEAGARGGHWAALGGPGRRHARLALARTGRAAAMSLRAARGRRGGAGAPYEYGSPYVRT